MILRHIKEQMIYWWPWQIVWALAFLLPWCLGGCVKYPDHRDRQQVRDAAKDFGRALYGNRFYDVSCKDGFHSDNCIIFYLYRNQYGEVETGTREVNCTNEGCTFSACHDQ